MKIAFLDRDGALIHEPTETKQIDSLEKLQILPGVFDGLKILQSQGYELVMVSNQNGIGTPSFPQESFDIPHTEMLKQFDEQGITFKEVFVCPHMPEDNCACRKPKTGMVDDFLNNNEINLENSLMIGDRETDGQFAENIGVRFIQVKTNGRFPRFAKVVRKTNETDIQCFLNLDGTGKSVIDTGIGFFDHMLELFSKHGLIDLELTCNGDLAVDEHHTIEDTGLVLGQAINEALGDKKGIERYGFFVPMDETLAEVVIDLSGRPYFVFEGSFDREMVGEFPTEMVTHFFQSVSHSLGCNLHMTLHRGENEHHKIEALFKCFARALRSATRGCPHDDSVPSTKGSL